MTAREAEAALADFIAARLPRFGDYQDAMATGEPLLFHALISHYLNAACSRPRLAARRPRRPGAPAVRR